MNKFIKAATAIVLASAASTSFAQLAALDTAPLNDGATGGTGTFTIEGDSVVGLGNITAGTNLLFNENDFDYTTSNEVYVSMINGPLVAAVQATHIDGKGMVFYSDTNAQTGTCEEYIPISNGDPANVIGIGTGVFVITLTIVPDANGQESIVNGCTPV